MSSYAFLAGMVSILRDLLNGACVYPFNLKEEGIGDFINLLIEENITVIGCNPTTFRHIVGSLSEEVVLLSVRLVYLVGEVLYPKDVDLYKKHFADDCLFVNLLGCTEIPSICAYIMNKKTQIKTHVVPVGYEFADQQVQLLDGTGKDVGFNCVGEVVIKSRYLSPGYLGQPDLTQAIFLPDPAGGDMRLHRTGDLGLRLPDGCLVHLGRKASQVKIRGHRVELAEVETAILALDGVKEVAVVARDDQNGGKILVAYLVPTRQPAPNASVLRHTLAERLPNYMIPSAFVMLDALSLTRTGKVCHNSLPMPSASRPDQDKKFVAPRDNIERQLAKIWSDILGFDTIGIQDSFFDIGGNSLLAARLLIQIEKIFDQKLPLAIIFQEPTIEEMGKILREKVKYNEWPSLFPVQTSGYKSPFFCMAGVKVLTTLAYHLGTDQPVYGLVPMSGKKSNHITFGSSRWLIATSKE